MSSTVTASIRESVRDMAIGKIKSNEKADRAIFKQAIDQRTWMVLFKMLNRQVFNDINGCISTGKEVSYHLQKMSIMQQKLTGKNWQSKSTGLWCWCSIVHTEDTRFQCNVEEDVIRITSGKDTGDMYYKTITGLHKALMKEDANAIEKPTNPGDNTKACGSESKSYTDTDEDSEGNESASKTEVQATVDEKAARKENKKKVRE
ncbi:uncharacterized protein LOC115663202 [Syzygium oleosum]|uniref:uncharacterized protein LOC115663202 n=1 Tax=Syzygium oleosum TaxID=219896 RepID=UPI0024B97AD8|nr:uncharacterized protein LOC115663202 [Syzygium oleosum]